MPFRLAGNLLFLSGVGPRHADEKMITGKVGADLTVEQGYEAAKLCGLNLLVNMIAAVGTLERVDTVLKVLGMVNAVPDFTQHPEVINGCTDLRCRCWAKGVGRHARRSAWPACRATLQWKSRRLCWCGALKTRRKWFVADQHLRRDQVVAGLRKAVNTIMSTSTVGCMLTPLAPGVAQCSAETAAEARSVA